MLKYFYIVFGDYKYQTRKLYLKKNIRNGDNLKQNIFRYMRFILPQRLTHS